MTYIKLPLDWDEMTAELTTAEKGSLIDAIVTYAKGEKYELSGNERYVFMHYKKIIDREAEMRESSALSRRTNGQKGGRPKKTEYNRTKPNETENNRTKPKITESICKEKEGEKEKEKENEKESNKEKDKEKAKEREAEKEAHTSCVFIFPSAEDVRAYCK